ncbi:MAG: hypothetical protein PHQ33_05875 [Bacteroidales bacterium]|nr:hypothetical protein [Bacteroidales bacterium]
MKKICGLIALAGIAIISFSCERECVCIGKHPSIEQTEEHSYGKMTTDECMDKQYRMNHDTTTITTYFWTCSN